LAADTGFVEFLDQTTGAYLADPSITQTTLYLKIG